MPMWWTLSNLWGRGSSCSRQVFKSFCLLFGWSHKPTDGGIKWRHSPEQGRESFSQSPKWQEGSSLSRVVFPSHWHVSSLDLRVELFSGASGLWACGKPLLTCRHVNGTLIHSEHCTSSWALGLAWWFVLSLKFLKRLPNFLSRLRLHEEKVIKDRRHHLKTYPNCFVAKELIDWLIEHKEASDRETAVKLMQKLADRGIIHHGERGGHRQSRGLERKRRTMSSIPAVNPPI